MTTSLLDDLHLAERIRALDREAFEAVVDAYIEQIVRAARGAGLNLDRAEDVAQATFTTFLESAPRFEGRSHVRTWLFGILYRKIAEERRRVVRERQLDDIEHVVDSRFDTTGSWSRPPRSTEADFEDAEIGRNIADCLGAAPARQRMAFLLREVEGLSTKEICKILEVSDTNLGVMLYRVRNRLRECLEAKGCGSDGC